LHGEFARHTLPRARARAGFIVFAPIARAGEVPTRALSAGFDAQAAIGAALGNAVGTNSFITGARPQLPASRALVDDGASPRRPQ
jgi:hypothetical protein